MEWLEKEEQGTLKQSTGEGPILQSLSLIGFSLAKNQSRQELNPWSSPLMSDAKTTRSLRPLERIHFGAWR